MRDLFIRTKPSRQKIAPTSKMKSPMKNSDAPACRHIRSEYNELVALARNLGAASADQEIEVGAGIGLHDRSNVKALVS